MNWRFPIQTALMAATVMTGASAMAAQYPPEIDRDPVLHERLEAAYTAKGPDYAPRTHLFDNGRARYVNRLIEEASPYLIQHAHNPVDWHPWSDETLAKAAAAGKPIFLSVGYATCHWCHVMEEESFDDEGVAALLNRHFISIKIDREEMPELDHLYITATQLQQGHAGWPNSLWLMPDGRPFHTGTYFPREQFTEIAAAIGQAWTDPQQRLQIDEVAGQLSGAVQEITQMASTRSVVLGETVFTSAAESLLRMHNALQGGFSDAQQFPQEGFLLYLLDHWRRTGEEASLQAATETLYAIAAGGIHDHVGGGFHRYTVDPNWRTPHFEKMLYNQGLLARTFVEAWEITGEPAFRRAAERTFGYVARDMTDPDGAFYAAEDADSLNAAGEREEGAFYAFTPGQLAAVAGEAAIAMLGVDAHATIEAGAVVHLDPQAETDFAELAPVLEAARQAREQRPRPLRDDKVIAGWNGLMIRALAEGSAAFGAPHYADQAALAGETVWTRLWDGERLHRLWAGGEAREEGALEDYAWLGLAFLALHDATGDAKWIVRARTLSGAMWARFEDGQGRLRMAAADGPLGPIYDSADGAVPSGESSALELLARLSHRNAGPGGETVHNTAIDRHRAETLRASLSAPMAETPLLRPDALTASRILDEGTTGRRRTAGRGVVQVHLLPDRLAFDIAPGWHLNAHEPGQDWLIGVALSGAEATWPVGESVTLGFSEDRLNVYSGRLSAPLAASPAGEIALTVQACSDSLCLEPETLIFRLP